jgi:hypothetical protein
MLNQANINIVEEVIANANNDKFITNDNTKFPSISYQYYDEANYAYDLMKTAPINSYELFASNGMGYQSYGFYKASNEQIYIIEANLNTLAYVYEMGSKFTDMLLSL